MIWNLNGARPWSGSEPRAETGLHTLEKTASECILGGGSWWTVLAKQGKRIKQKGN